MPSYIKSALIIGGGIAGPFAAISLAAHGITSRIFETRTSPTTIGGAINLSPNAVRILAAHGLLPRLHTLGCCVRTLEVFSAHSQKRIGDVPFGDEERYGFDSVRILRSDLQCVLLEAAEERGVAVEYGKKLVDVEEEAEDEVTAVFEDGTKVTAEVLLGCDGIHSAVRGKHVDPGCRASYTGVASAYGIFDLTELTAPLQEIHGKSTRIATSRQGSFLTSICDAAETRLFWAVVMAVDEQDAVRDDGRARQQAATREHIISRFSECPGFGSTVSVVVEKTPDVFFYPVNEMPVGNRWWRGRCILLGDAAHAMPPQGQSIGLALEDVEMLTRVLTELKVETGLDERFARWDALLRPRIEAAHRHAARMFEGVKNLGWFKHLCREWLYWVFLGLFRWHSNDGFLYDVSKAPL